MKLIKRGSIFCIFLIIVSLLLVGSIPALNKVNNKIISPLTIDDILDQKQELHNRESNIRDDILVAQEFKPSMTPLTKVILKIRKTLVIQEPLIVSIRKDLYDFDLTFIPVLGSQIPFNTFPVEFDFEDIEVNVGETYYIVVRSPASQSFWWQTQYNLTNQGDPYDRGKLWQSNNNGIEWESLDDSNHFFDCNFQTYSYDSKSDLHCEGTLSWTNITPKSEVTGSFTVENIGTPFSYLNWKIYSWPSWGVWTFSTKSDTNVKPEDGPLTIQVSIKTPNVTNNDYSGKLKIINIDDEDDFCIIDCALSTPKRKLVYNSRLATFFENVIQFIKKLDRPILNNLYLT